MVKAAVGGELRLHAAEQRAVRRGNAVAAVFAGDDDGVDCRALYHGSSGSWRNTCRVPSLQSLLSALK